MNVVILSGQIAANGTVRGQRARVLAFVVNVKHPANGEDDETITPIPVVIFNPAESVAKMITTEGKGLFVEFQGRINISRYEHDDRPRSSLEIIGYNKTLLLFRNGQT